MARAALAVVLGVAFTTWGGQASAQESGVAQAREATRAAPASPEAALAYGTALRRAGHEGEALIELRRGLAISAGRADIIGRLQWEIARTHVAKREFEPAMAMCRAMAKTPRAEPASHVCAAETHLLWRRGTDTLAELAELAKVKEPPVDVQYYGKVAAGRAYELASKDSEAESAYAEAIRLAGTRSEAHVLYGALLQRVGRDGLPSLKKAVELEPHDATAQMELGRALTPGSPESITALEHAVAERSTSTEALRALADGYVLANRLPEAKKTVESVLRLSPNDAAAHVVAGRLALVEGRVDDAIKEGDTGTRLMPNLQPARVLAGDAWAKKGEIDLAVEAYQAALGLDHSDPTPLVNAAQACLAAGRVTSAKAFGIRATKDFPSNGAAWTALGDALAVDRDISGAKAAYDTAKRSRGVDPTAIDKKLARLK